MQTSKQQDMDTKYIFVTGGVVSSLGKGIISASIGTWDTTSDLQVFTQHETTQ